MLKLISVEYEKDGPLERYVATYNCKTNKVGDSSRLVDYDVSLEITPKLNKIVASINIDEADVEGGDTMEALLKLADHCETMANGIREALTDTTVAKVSIPLMG